MMEEFMSEKIITSGHELNILELKQNYTHQIVK